MFAMICFGFNLPKEDWATHMPCHYYAIHIYIYLVIHSLHGISFHVGKNDFIKPLHEGVSDANQC
jgi:hypothetical protein